jgi:hypothetical protein
VRRRFREPDVARNDRAVELLAEVLLELGPTLSASVLRGSYIVRSSPRSRARVQMRAHFLHRLHESRTSLRARNTRTASESAPRPPRRAVERQQRERRRAIEQDEIVVGRDGRDRGASSAATPRRARP